MAREVIGTCPACGRRLEVRRLECGHCGTAVEGRFDLCRFCQLPPDQRQFVEVFLVARGNIREVERVLGISYPTVRSRLEAVLEALGHRTERGDEESERRREVLAQLERGEITAKEAIKLLRE